jgi:hypothetical protein
MTRQIKHVRRSKYGRPFKAGKGRLFKVIKKKYDDGFVMSPESAMFHAKSILKNKSNGTILFLGFLNGWDAFVKEHNQVRVSTQEEYDEYVRVAFKPESPYRIAGGYATCDLETGRNIPTWEWNVYRGSTLLGEHKSHSSKLNDETLGKWLNKHPRIKESIFGEKS